MFREAVDRVCYDGKVILWGLREGMGPDKMWGTPMSPARYPSAMRAQDDEEDLEGEDDIPEEEDGDLEEEDFDDFEDEDFDDFEDFDDEEDEEEGLEPAD